MLTALFRARGCRPSTSDARLVRRWPKHWALVCAAEPEWPECFAVAGLPTLRAQGGTCGRRRSQDNRRTDTGAGGSLGAGECRRSSEERGQTARRMAAAARRPPICLVGSRALRRALGRSGCANVVRGRVLWSACRASSSDGGLRRDRSSRSQAPGQALPIARPLSPAGNRADRRLRHLGGLRADGRRGVRSAPPPPTTPSRAHRRTRRPQPATPWPPASPWAAGSSPDPMICGEPRPPEPHVLHRVALV